MNRFEARALIVQKFGTQIRASRCLGLHPARFSLLLNGHLKPTPQESQKFREAFGSELLELMRQRYRAAEGSGEETDMHTKNVN